MRSSLRRPCSRLKEIRDVNGFTLVESVLAISLFSLVLVSFARAVDRGASEGETFTGLVDLHMDGHAALEELTESLRNSAFSSDGTYPQFLTTNEFIASGWALNLPEVSKVSPHPNRGIIFVLPADADLDGLPDLTVGGDVIWSGQQIAFVVSADGTGKNRIERWVDGAFDSIVGRGIETLTIDSNATAPTELELGFLRFRVVVEKLVDGQSLSVELERIIRITQNALIP